MIPELFDLGFKFYKGVKLPENVISYFLNKENYKGYYSEEEHIREIGTIDTSILNQINISFPDEISKILSRYKISWGANMAEMGFELYPHSDVVLDETKYSAGTSAIIFWICSTSDFIGREFIWGKVKDMQKIPKVKEGYTDKNWDDPNLETLGLLKPKTGSGVIIDRTNPIHWHGVKKLMSDVQIVTVVGYD